MQARKTLNAFFSAVLLLAAPAAYGAEKIPFDLYVMSQCPFGVQAENAVFPAVKSLEKQVDFRLHFIANEAPGEDGKQVFRSLHGQPEVEENIRQLCIRKHFPKKFMDYVLERNKNYKSPQWQEAAKTVGLDPAAVDACSTGEEGASLLSENIKTAASKNIGASPTIHIAGSPYSGPRGQRSITLAVCQAMQSQGGKLPEACKQAEAMPPDPVPNSAAGCGPAPAQAPGACGPGGAPAAPVPFDIQAVVEDCPVCAPDYQETLKRFYPMARFKTVKADSAEGKALIKSYAPRGLPLYILGKEVEQTPTFNQMRSLLIPIKGRYIVRPETARPVVQLTRERVPNHLDLFVNSLSPLTGQAEAELFRLFSESQNKDLTFSLHFVVQEAARPAKGEGGKTKGTRSASVKEMRSSAPGPLVSANGPEELAESRRQACLFQHASMGDFFKYLGCRSQNLNDPRLGEACLVPNEAIKACIDGPEGEQLLRSDGQLARALGINLGPAVLWENRYGPFHLQEVGSLESLLSPGAYQ